VEIVVANLAAAKTKRVTWNGRDYIVAPLTLIVPGVLPGSQGPLLYPPEEVRKNPTDWNGMPIVVYHPLGPDGKPTSARDPQILEKSGIGTVFNGKATGKLAAEGWFDVQRTKEIDNRVLEALEKGKPMELSTGLTLRQYPVPEGTVHNGPGRTGPYVAIARDYKPDHLAILPDQRGACGIKDGCGLLVNSDNPISRLSSYFQGLVLLTNGGRSQPRVPKGSPKGGEFVPTSDHQVGDIVTIMGGEHKGKQGIVQGRFVPGELLIRVSGKYNKSVADEHIKATGKQDKETVDLERSFKEQQARERADDARSGDKPVDITEREAKIVGGKVEGTPYTKKELFDQAIKAGKSMFGKALDVGPLKRVVVADLKDLKKGESGHSVVEDYEYVFKPSTGKGLDVSGREWSPSWADKDGHIYSAYEDTVFVIKTPKAKIIHNEASAWDLIASRLEEVLNYNPSQARIPAGRPGGGQFATVKAAGAAVKKAESKVAKAQLTLEKAKAALKVEKNGLVVAKRGLTEAKARERGTSAVAKSAISKASGKPPVDVSKHLAETKALYGGSGPKKSEEKFQAEVKAHMEGLRKSLNKEQAIKLSEGMGLVGLRTKKAALDTVENHIRRRRQSVQRAGLIDRPK
jgi:hypothetical protein